MILIVNMHPERPRARWDITIGGTVLFLGALYLLHPYYFKDTLIGLVEGLAILCGIAFLFLATQGAAIKTLAYIYRKFSSVKGGLPLNKKQFQSLTVTSLREAKLLQPYLTTEELKTRHIALVHCEDEGCGFFVEFKYPNCTFFYCKLHKIGFNVDLNTASEAGVACEQHGKMERYDLLSEDNVCPICKNTIMAIMSVGQ